jgi:hypothetical protein
MVATVRKILFQKLNLPVSGLVETPFLLGSGSGPMGIPPSSILLSP